MFENPFSGLVTELIGDGVSVFFVVFFVIGPQRWSAPTNFWDGPFSPGIVAGLP